MNERIEVIGSNVYIKVASKSKYTPEVGLTFRWTEARRFAEQLQRACDKARRNAERGEYR